MPAYKMGYYKKLNKINRYWLIWSDKEDYLMGRLHEKVILGTEQDAKDAVVELQESCNK